MAFHSSFKKKNVNAKINTFQKSLLSTSPRTPSQDNWMLTAIPRICLRVWALIASPSMSSTLLNNSSKREVDDRADMVTDPLGGSR